MDVDVLRLQERVLLALELGESHFREFKSACEGLAGKKTPRPMKEISQDIGRTLVAFANADGGELLVGVEDDGEITVMDATDQQVQTLLDSPNSVVHKDTPLPPTRSVRLLFEGKTVLYFSVSKGTNYVYLTADGRCIQRRDRESVPMATEAIRFSRTETISREYDRAFVDNAQIADLDFELVGHVAEHLSKGMSVEKCLQHIELAEFDGSRLRLRRAALLLFGKDPLRWHPRLQVRILKVEGTDMGTGDKYNVKKDEEVTDNILNLIETSWEFLRPHLTETRFSRDALFKTQIIYPELACREALINAIAHRDYSNEGRADQRPASSVSRVCRGAAARAIGSANPEVLASSATMACSGSDAAIVLARLIALSGPDRRRRRRRGLGEDRLGPANLVRERFEGGLGVLVGFSQDGDLAGG